MRRIAYVESKDGTDSGTYQSGYHGGIWQVDNVALLDTQKTDSHPLLTKKFAAIEASFGIDWRKVKWEDLRKPLYSGLAARLFLSSIPEHIPVASDIRAQGQYWKDHYNKSGSGNVSKFIKDIGALTASEER